MKTPFSRQTAFAAAFVASLLIVKTYAGPGPQSWTNPEKSAGNAEPAKPAATAIACPGSQEVAVTAMKPAWANGRGPLTEVQTGTERICHVCPVTTSTTAGANGRGPVTHPETTSVGPTHRCSTGCTQ